MRYLRQEELLSRLAAGEHEAIVDEYVFAEYPYAFSGSAADYQLLRRQLASATGIPLEDIAMVGSGSVGFSLAPDRYGQPYGEDSDWDMLLVSDTLFDTVWYDLLALPRGKFLALPKHVRTRLKHDIYWGGIMPDKLRDATRVSRVWFEAFRGLSLRAEFTGREVTGRLYRTWCHARAYQLHCMREIARQRLSADT